jgi:hypothetical protein
MQIIITCGFQLIDKYKLFTEKKLSKGKIFDSEIVAIFYTRVPTNEQVQRQNFHSECF